MQETIKQNYKGKHKEFAELLSQDLNSRSFKENEIVEGTISKIDERYCFVDIGGKSDGAILLEEFKFAKELDKISVGSKIKVFLEIKKMKSYILLRLGKVSWVKISMKKLVNYLLTYFLLRRKLKTARALILFIPLIYCMKCYPNAIFW